MALQGAMLLKVMLKFLSAGTACPGTANCSLLSHGTRTGSFPYNHVGAPVRRLFAVLILSLPLLTLTAFAEEWSKSYTVGAKPALHVDTNDAAIEITRGSGNTIAARVTTEGYKIGEGLRISEHQDGDKVDL